MNGRFRVFSAVLLLLCLRPVQAADPGCPDVELFSGKLITDICWGCHFPIRIAGLSIGSGDRPAAASNQVVCACNDGRGIPHPGFVVSLWEPARIVELTRAGLLPGPRRHPPSARQPSLARQRGEVRMGRLGHQLLQLPLVRLSTADVP